MKQSERSDIVNILNTALTFHNLEIMCQGLIRPWSPQPNTWCEAKPHSYQKTHENSGTHEALRFSLGPSWTSLFCLNSSKFRLKLEIFFIKKYWPNHPAPLRRVEFVDLIRPTSFKIEDFLPGIMYKIHQIFFWDFLFSYIKILFISVPLI